MLVRLLDRWFYPRQAEAWDRRLLVECLDQHLGDAQSVLDLGAGRGAHGIDLRAAGRRVCGVDVDDAVHQNPLVDEAAQIAEGTIPYPDATFDFAWSRYVWEHVEHPPEFLAEVHRVLKPGGVYVSLTPNFWHYVPLIASVTPHWFHEWINAVRGRPTRDTFPTFYRLNTPPAIRRHARLASFDVERMTISEGRPEYFRRRLLVLGYPLGIAYERLVNACGCLERFRVTLIAVLRKPPAGESPNDERTEVRVPG